MSTTKEEGGGVDGGVGQQTPTRHTDYIRSMRARGPSGEGEMEEGGGEEEVLGTGLRQLVTQHLHSNSLPDASCFPNLTTEGWAGGSKNTFASVDEQRKLRFQQSNSCKQRAFYPAVGSKHNQHHHCVMAFKFNPTHD